MADIDLCQRTRDGLSRTLGAILYTISYFKHLVEALRYKPEGRGFDSRWCHWNFSLT